MNTTMRAGMNQSTIQQMNKTLLLNLLREQGLSTRAVLSQISGLNKATITNNVGEFIQAGLIEETGLITGDNGRRSIGIRLSDSTYYVIGVRLARTYCKVATFNLRGEQERLLRIDIDSDNEANASIDSIEDAIQQLIDENSKRRLVVIGMALPGPFLKDQGEIAILTGGRKFERVDFKEALERRFGSKVIIEHDAKMGALAQLWHDPEVSKDDSLIYVAAGEGIGAGIIINGDIVYGAVGTAGEIGHTSIDFRGEPCECGNRGCLERYCSLLTVLSKARQAAGSSLTAEQIVGRIGADADITGIYRHACHMLGYGIVNLINTCNPSIVILGDELSHLDGSIMIDEINQVLNERLIPEIRHKLVIKVSSAVHDSVLHGIGARGAQWAFSHTDCISQQ